jgi:ADP-ribose pyrophosphatase
MARRARSSAKGSASRRRHIVLVETPWMRVVRRRVRLRPGAAPEDYDIVESVDWAMICARAPDGRFVMVVQDRPAIRRRQPEFPAGRIDPGETASASIRRELVEETGHAVKRLVRLGPFFADTGRLTNRAHLFFGEVVPVARWTPEPGVTVRHVTARQVDRMIADGRISALHHVGLWLLVKARGLVGPT